MLSKTLLRTRTFCSDFDFCTVSDFWPLFCACDNNSCASEKKPSKKISKTLQKQAVFSVVFARSPSLFLPPKNTNMASASGSGPSDSASAQTWDRQWGTASETRSARLVLKRKREHQGVCCCCWCACRARSTLIHGVGLSEGPVGEGVGLSVGLSDGPVGAAQRNNAMFCNFSHSVFGLALLSNSRQKHKNTKMLRTFCSDFDFFCTVSEFWPLFSLVRQQFVRIRIVFARCRKRKKKQAKKCC